MRETEDYPTNDLMRQGKKQRHTNGWRSIHTDFINNNESDGYHVTYDNTPDPPPPPRQRMNQSQLMSFLADQYDIELN